MFFQDEENQKKEADKRAEKEEAAIKKSQSKLQKRKGKVRLRFQQDCSMCKFEVSNIPLFPHNRPAVVTEKNQIQKK